MCLARRVVCVGVYAWLDGQYVYIRTHTSGSNMIVPTLLPASDLPPYTDVYIYRFNPTIIDN